MQFVRLESGSETLKTGKWRLVASGADDETSD